MVKEIEILGQKVNIAFDNYVLFQFSKRIGYDAPAEAVVALSQMNNDKGQVTVTGVENFCALLHEMLKRGAKKSKTEMSIEFEDLFDCVDDEQLITEVISLFGEGMPQPETTPSEKKQVAALS